MHALIAEAAGAKQSRAEAQPNEVSRTAAGPGYHARCLTEEPCTR